MAAAEKTLKDLLSPPWSSGYALHNHTELNQVKVILIPVRWIRATICVVDYVGLLSRGSLRPSARCNGAGQHWHVDTYWAPTMDRLQQSIWLSKLKSSQPRPTTNYRKSVLTVPSRAVHHRWSIDYTENIPTRPYNNRLWRSYLLIDSDCHNKRDISTQHVSPSSYLFWILELIHEIITEPGHQGCG